MPNAVMDVVRHARGLLVRQVVVGVPVAVALVVQVAQLLRRVATVHQHAKEIVKNLALVALLGPPALLVIQHAREDVKRPAHQLAKDLQQAVDVLVVRQHVKVGVTPHVTPLALVAAVEIALPIVHLLAVVVFVPVVVPGNVKAVVEEVARHRALTLVMVNVIRHVMAHVEEDVIRHAEVVAAII